MNFYASAWNVFAREVAFLGFYKNDFAINSSMNGEVAAHEGARTCDFGCAGLADEYFAGFYILATKALNAKSLAGIVV